MDTQGNISANVKDKNYNHDDSILMENGILSLKNETNNDRIKDKENNNSILALAKLISSYALLNKQTNNGKFYEANKNNILDNSLKSLAQKDDYYSKYNNSTSNIFPPSESKSNLDCFCKNNYPCGKNLCLDFLGNKRPNQPSSFTKVDKNDFLINNKTSLSSNLDNLKNSHTLNQVQSNNNSCFSSINLNTHNASNIINNLNFNSVNNINGINNANNQREYLLEELKNRINIISKLFNKNSNNITNIDNTNISLPEITQNNASKSQINTNNNIENSNIKVNKIEKTPIYNITKKELNSKEVKDYFKYLSKNIIKNNSVKEEKITYKVLQPSNAYEINDFDNKLFSKNHYFKTIDLYNYYKNNINPDTEIVITKSRARTKGNKDVKNKNNNSNNIDRNESKDNTEINDKEQISSNDINDKDQSFSLLPVLDDDSKNNTFKMKAQFAPIVTKTYLLLEDEKLSNNKNNINSYKDIKRQDESLDNNFIINNPTNTLIQSQSISDNLTNNNNSIYNNKNNEEYNDINDNKENLYSKTITKELIQKRKLENKKIFIVTKSGELPNTQKTNYINKTKLIKETEENNKSNNNENKSTTDVEINQELHELHKKYPFLYLEKKKKYLNKNLDEHQISILKNKNKQAARILRSKKKKLISDTIQHNIFLKEKLSNLNKYYNELKKLYESKYKKKYDC